jgi:hypothetical protein
LRLSRTPSRQLALFPRLTTVALGVAALGTAASVGVADASTTGTSGARTSATAALSVQTVAHTTAAARRTTATRPTLRYGSRGSAVRDLQRRLRISADGWFGPQTRKAVRTFQHSHHLRVTGVVDAATWRKLPAPPKVKHAAPSKAKRTTYAATGVEHLNWRALADCEASGNPRAYNPAGYYGLYQFDVRTWHGVGGRGVPTSASAAEQTYRAQLLYKQRGSSPWPVCGRRLFS